MPRIYTKTGDDGTTGLLYGGRVPKDDLLTEAYGTTEEDIGRVSGALARVLTRAWPAATLAASCGSGRRPG